MKDLVSTIDIRGQSSGNTRRDLKQLLSMDNEFCDSIGSLKSKSKVKFRYLFVLCLAFVLSCCKNILQKEVKADMFEMDNKIQIP